MKHNDHSHDSRAESSKSTNSNKWLYISLISILIVTGVLYFGYKWNMSQQFSPIKNSQQIIQKDDVMPAVSNAMMRKESPTIKPESASQGYMDYAPELLNSNLVAGKKVTLFFAASWCPSCRALDKSIQADLTSIPSDSLILRVNYDDSSDLKKKYQVVTQHTTVTLNADGTLKSKKLGAKTIAEVLGL